jgi:hypothetical protein
MKTFFIILTLAPCLLAAEPPLRLPLHDAMAVALESSQPRPEALVIANCKIGRSAGECRYGHLPGSRSDRHLHSYAST